jgi:hypothetical protein
LTVGVEAGVSVFFPFLGGVVQLQSATRRIFYKFGFVSN